MEKLTVRRLTPPGKGGVAVTLLKGSGAEEVFRQFYQGSLGSNTEYARPYFGRLQLLNGQYEDVVVHRISDSEIEIHSHGGELLVNAVETLFASSQAEIVTNNEKPEMIPSASLTAQQLLPYAPTERIARLLLETGNIPVGSESDESAKLLRFLHRCITNPFRIVLAGAANAGKSSLLNAILGFQRSIVEPTPGTTRDIVSGQSAVNGIPFIFYDTAGIRSDTADAVEAEGIYRATQAAADADLTVWVIDSNSPEEAEVITSAPSAPLLCFNKSDLCRCIIPPKAVAVSAATGEGIAELLEAVYERTCPENIGRTTTV
ncbi:MAG: 50S ribosome-binding GTPase [Planctomycetaceae bacterium]|jgi:tRNA modification GTPase|nr:50S ribosome-binding GTPase [Planctomycetaceae bacterium]